MKGLESNSENPYLQVDNNNEHVVLYALNEKDQIVGFRYFFFNPASNICRCFATFVDKNYRKQGIASKLIIASFSEAISYGKFSKFEIRLTPPTDDENMACKNALLHFYQNLARQHEKQYMFKIINHFSKDEFYGCTDNEEFFRSS